MNAQKAKVIFATHMQAARTRKLTTYEKNQLSEARQVLRHSRKPAMNKPTRNPLRYIAYSINTTTGALMRVAVNQSSPGKAERDARIYSKRNGESWLYAVGESGHQILVGHYINGRLGPTEPPKHNPLTRRKAKEMLKRHEYTSGKQRRFLGARAAGLPRRKANPGKPVLIYGQVDRIYATKKQNHICDEECKRNGHRYFHDFSSKPKMYGLPDGSLLIKS